MAHGKYLSLDEARRKGQIARFCKEHPSVGNEKDFDALLDAMAKNKPRNSKEGVGT